LELTVFLHVWVIVNFPPLEMIIVRKSSTSSASTGVVIWKSADLTELTHSQPRKSKN